MSVFGNVGEFNPAREKLTSYLERLDGFFHTQKIGKVEENATNAEKGEADKDKVQALISVIGPKGYSTLQDICKPQRPAEKSYRDLIGLLKGHFVKTKIEVAESFKFHNTYQKEKLDIKGPTVDLDIQFATLVQLKVTLLLLAKRERFTMLSLKRKMNVQTCIPYSATPWILQGQFQCILQ